GLRDLFRGNDEHYQVPERRCRNGVGPRRLRQQHQALHEQGSGCRRGGGVRGRPGGRRKGSVQLELRYHVCPRPKTRRKAPLRVHSAATPGRSTRKE
ncbi:unnamed protein product, partial [Ectocarpus sp. 4 AP-2014]